MTLQQAVNRFGTSFAPRTQSGGQYAAAATPESNFIQPSGLMGPGQMFAVLTMRHMHLYGTTRDHLAEVAISTRANAIRRPTSLMREPLTRDDYFGARMISEPLCLYDFCLETDGAVAVITTTAERAKDLRQPPVYVMGTANGGMGRWGQAITWMNMPDEYFVSSGHRPVAQRHDDIARAQPSQTGWLARLDPNHFQPSRLLDAVAPPPRRRDGPRSRTWKHARGWVRRFLCS